MMRKTTLISPHKVEYDVCFAHSSGSSDHVQTLKNNSFNMSVLPLLCHSDCQSEKPEGQMGILMENMVLFSSTLLQKLYCGTFMGDAESLVHFFADQIVVVRRLPHTRHRHAPHADAGPRIRNWK